MKRDGAFVNPLAAHARQAPGEPIPPTQLSGFRELRDQRLAQLSATLLAAAPNPNPDAVKADARK